MKIVKIILNSLVVFFGGILSLYSFAQLFKSFNSLTQVKDPHGVGYHIGYLITTILFCSLGVWLFLKGVDRLQKPKQEGDVPE